MLMPMLTLKQYRHSPAHGVQALVYVIDAPLHAVDHPTGRKSELVTGLWVWRHSISGNTTKMGMINHITTHTHAHTQADVDACGCGDTFVQVGACTITALYHTTHHLTHLGASGGSDGSGGGGGRGSSSLWMHVEA